MTGSVGMASKPQLSVVIPAYNEEAVIGSTVEAIAQYLADSQIRHEILLVDDGSTDRTPEIVRELAQGIPSVRMLQSGHLGKGGAVKRGMLEAQGAHLLFMDADHSTPIQQWEKCAPWLRDGYEVVIGSRKMPGADVKVHQPLLREAMGKVFTWLTNAILTVRITDITCGFKCFQAEAARQIFQLQRMNGWGFDAEILFIARRRGYRIKEVPVAWADDARTKVRLVKDAAGSLQELIGIRLGGWRGWYPRVSSDGNE
jgi:dolichyl-phosphate beta-glucosyltransferase